MPGLCVNCQLAFEKKPKLKGYKRHSLSSECMGRKISLILDDYCIPYSRETPQFLCKICYTLLTKSQIASSSEEKFLQRSNLTERTVTDRTPAKVSVKTPNLCVNCQLPFEIKVRGYKRHSLSSECMGRKISLILDDYFIPYLRATPQFLCQICYTLLKKSQIAPNYEKKFLQRSNLTKRIVTERTPSKALGSMPLTLTKEDSDAVSAEEKIMYPSPGSWHTAIDVSTTTVIRYDGSKVAEKMKVLENDEFKKQILETLLESYTLGNHLCDVTLLVGDVTIKAHKAVLVSFSLYFAEYFLQHDSSTCKISPGIETKSLVSLLNYMYTGLLQVDEMSQMDIYKAAVRLNIPTVQELLLKMNNCLISLEYIGKIAGNSKRTSSVVETDNDSKNKHKNPCVPSQNSQLSYLLNDQIELVCEPEQFITGVCEDEDYNPFEGRRDLNKDRIPKITGVEEVKQCYGNEAKKYAEKYVSSIDKKEDKKSHKRNSKTGLSALQAKKTRVKSKRKECFPSKKGFQASGKICRTKTPVEKKMVQSNLKPAKCNCSKCGNTFHLFSSLTKHMVSKHKMLVSDVNLGRMYSKWAYKRLNIRRFLCKPFQDSPSSTSSEMDVDQYFASEPLCTLEEAKVDANFQTERVISTSETKPSETASAEISKECAIPRLHNNFKTYRCVCGQSFDRYCTFTLHARKSHLKGKLKSFFSLVQQQISATCMVNDHERTNRPRATASGSHVQLEHSYFINKFQKSHMVVSDESAVNRVAEHAECKPQDCPVCFKKFTTTYGLKGHLEKLHDWPADQASYIAQRVTVIACEANNCNFTTYRRIDLKKHVQDYHPEIKYWCPTCDKMFQVKEYLNKHIRVKHPSDPVKAMKNYCAQCGKRYHSPSYLMKHNYREHGIKHRKLKIYPCEFPGCDFEALEMFNMKRHVRVRHSDRKLVPCPHCDKQLKSQVILRQHIERIHLNVRPHMCHICGKAYGANADLQAHINFWHSDDKRFKCQICSYGTSTKHAFRKHMFVQHKKLVEDDKRRMLTCDECDYKTILKWQFRNHMNRHKNIKQYTCDICNKQFVSPSNLRGHVLFAHSNKEFPCPECEYRAKAKATLMEHIRTQHKYQDIKPYKCPYCDFHCSSGGNCRKHVMQRHKGKEVYYEKDEAVIKAVNQEVKEVKIVPV